MVQGFNHEVIIPRDPQSGQPTGQRVHKPVVITKVFDKASPLLLAALTSGERLTKVEIQWYRTSAAGTQEHYYTTVLEDAIIVDIKDYMHNCQDPGNAHFTHLEDVHFTYRKITWTHEVSGTSGSDDWRSPVAAAVGGDLGDRIAVAVGENHRAARFRSAAEVAAVAQVDGRRGRRDGVHGSAALAASIAGRVGSGGVDHGSIRQRRGRREAPVAAAVGGDLPDRIAAAIGQGHRGARFGGAADLRAVARIDHRRGRRHRVHGGAGRSAGIAGRVADYLAIALLHHSEGVAVNESLEVTPSRHLDLGQLHLAARINISEWRNNKQSKQYISFIKGKGGKKVSDYFRDFIGCQEGVDSPSETRTLLKAFSDFVESEDMAEEQAREKTETLVDYATSQARIGEPMTLDALSELMDDQQPSASGSRRSLRGYRCRGLPVAARYRASCLRPGCWSRPGRTAARSGSGRRCSRPRPCIAPAGRRSSRVFRVSCSAPQAICAAASYSAGLAALTVRQVL